MHDKVAVSLGWQLQFYTYPVFNSSIMIKTEWNSRRDKVAASLGWQFQFQPCGNKQWLGQTEPSPTSAVFTTRLHCSLQRGKGGNDYDTEQEEKEEMIMTQNRRKKRK